MPGLRYLPNGGVIDIGEGRERIPIGGIGGCHGPSNYERRSRDLQGWARRHFTHDECERLSSHGGVDVLHLHDAPAGVEFTWRRKDGSVRRRYRSEAEGVAQAVARTRPLGESVKGLSPSTITRLKRAWETVYADWRQRDWRGHEFVYLWADRIYVNVRAEERSCVLVVVDSAIRNPYFREAVDRDMALRYAA